MRDRGFGQRPNQFDDRSSNPVPFKKLLPHDEDDRSSTRYNGAMDPRQGDRIRVKFCGFRRAEDIDAAIVAGADAIGLNFCVTSPRFITPSQAAELAKVNDSRACLVGVFVNPTVAEIQEILKLCPLDMIQLHGEESPELVSEQGLPPLIRALPWREASKEDADFVRAWSSAARAVKLAGFLVDAYDPKLRGGTGRVARWDLLSPRPDDLAGCRMFLAGGLTAANVAEAIRVSDADAVDTASGIESAPGIKDAEKMRAFVIQARKGFENAKRD